MDANVTAATPDGRPGIRRHLGSELTRSGYALLLSSLVTSGLGLAYWFGAARLYRASELGKGAGLVSAMLLVTSLSTAGLKRGLIRFIRTAGPSAPRLIGHVYAAGVALALLGAGLLLSGVFGRFEQLEVLQEGASGPVLMLVSVAVWAIFVLQDAALIGGRRATVVPLSNAAFSVAKIAVLALMLLLPVEQEWGLLLSWVIPGAAVAAAANWWALRGGLRLEPVRSSTDPPTLRSVIRFTSADYVASVFWQGAVYLTPLIVLALAGSTANAHFYLAFQMAYAVFLISSNITDALVADGAADQRDLPAKVRQVGLQIAVLLVPAVGILVVAAPQVMGIFGPGYAEAVPALRLLAVAGFANALTTVLVGVAHLRKRLTIVMVLHVTMSVVTIGLALLLIPSRGVTGAAEAWLVAQVAALAIGLCYTARYERGAARAARVAVVSGVSAARGRAMAWRARRAVPDLLRQMPDGSMSDGPVRLLSHQHDVVIVTAGDGPAAVVARIAIRDAGRESIAAHAVAIERIHGDGGMDAVRPLVPHLLARDGSDRWLLESARPGIPVEAVSGAGARRRAVHSAIDVLERLHGTTEEHRFVGESELAAWVHRPVASLARVVRSEGAVDALAGLHAQLVEDLGGRTVTVSACHGDASLGNVLVDGDEAVAGIIDWDAAGHHLAETDVYLHLLSRRTQWGGGELGEAVIDILRHGWRPEETEVLGRTQSRNGHLRPSTLLLLTWLDHAAANLTKTERYGRNRWWVRHNVEQVLTAIALDAVVPIGAPTSAAMPAVARPAGSPDEVRDHPGRRWLDRALWRTSPQRLALGCGAVTALAGVAAWMGAAPEVRIPLVLAALLAAPALVAGRHLGALVPAARVVLGAGLAVSVEVLLAEVLLYTGLWQPGLLLVLVGALTAVMAVLSPEEVGRRATTDR